MNSGFHVKESYVIKTERINNLFYKEKIYGTYEQKGHGEMIIYWRERNREDTSS